jgi:4-carboxymuconolactone decarboxylase
MSQELFEKGLAERSAVLGAEYVGKALGAADDFNREFQELVTEYCWGFAWCDDTLDRKQRSLMNLSMIAALNRMTEWELHFRAAITNGLTRQELKSVLHQIAIYCGMPVGVECFRIANRVFSEIDGSAEGP